MKTLLKTLVIALCCVLCCSPFSIFADYSSTLPGSYSLTDYQISVANQYIYNADGYPNLLVFSNNNGNLFVVTDVYYDGDLDRVTYDNYLRITQDGTWSFRQGAYSVNLGTNSNYQVFYFKYKDIVLHSVGRTSDPPLYPVYMNFIYEFTNYYKSSDSSIIDISTGSFDVPFSGYLDCSAATSSYCEAYNVNSPYFDTLTAHFPYVDFSATLSTLFYESSDLKVTWQIVFDDYYSGTIDGYFPSRNFIASSGAVVTNNMIYFTDVNSITLTYSQSSLVFDENSAPIFQPQSFNLTPSGGRPVYNPSGNALIESGNSSSQSVSSSLVEENSSLNSSIDSYDTFESQFNDNLTSSLSSINLDSVQLGNSSDFVKTAAWIKVQFDDILNASGLYKSAISFVLIVGLALLLIGRRL